MKSYELSLHPDYCSHWGIQEAIRELLQNMLDSQGSNEINCEGNTLTITNKDTTIPSSTLLMGVSSKKSDKSKIGAFGEGFKVALLILCREGVDVKVYNGDKVWTPDIRYSDTYECSVLCIDEELNTNSDNTDLTFELSLLSSENINTMVDRCLYLQDINDLGEYEETDVGRVFYDIKGKLFVGGLYVKDTDLLYSYDFNPIHLALNRDRQSVDGWDLGIATSKMLSLVEDTSKVVEAVDSEDMGYSKYRSYNFSEEVKEAIYDQHLSESEDKPIVVNDETEKKSMIELGYDESLIYVESSGTKSALITSSNKYCETLSSIKKNEKIDKSPIDFLQEFRYNHLNESNQDHLKEELDEIITLFEMRGVIWQ